MTIRTIAAALLLAGSAQAAVVPKPLFRDPVHDGAADPSIVYDEGRREWLMLYTNRRANLVSPDPKDVSWVHGTRIGLAASSDGANWRYRGIADLPAACTGPTLWAPEVKRFGDRYHMWLTIVPGVFGDWNAPRRIVHLTSRDLRRWTCGKVLDLGSDRVIDASVVALGPGRYRLWYKDERDGSRIRWADSTDLEFWRLGGIAIDTPGEAPKVFRWRDRWWMVSDAWQGLLVARSENAKHWVRQADYLLALPGRHPSDRAKGQHPDVVVSADRAWLFYFVHQGGEPKAAANPPWAQRSVLQAAELKEVNGELIVDRNAAAQIDLTPAPASSGGHRTVSRVAESRGDLSIHSQRTGTSPPEAGSLW